MSRHWVLGIAGALALAASAQAADLPVAPVYKAQPAAIASGGFYIWADGYWESARLPTYALGLHNADSTTLADRGPVQSFDPRVTGGGGRGAIVNTAAYNAASTLSSDDFGVRVGLDTAISLTPWLTFGAGGYVGWVDRRTTLSASDNFTSTLIGVGASTVSASATTSAFVANGEVGLMARVSPTAKVRLFAGINYDDRVPGVSTPAYLGPHFPAQTGAIPA